MDLKIMLVNCQKGCIGTNFVVSIKADFSHFHALCS